MISVPSFSICGLALQIDKISILFKSFTCFSVSLVFSRKVFLQVVLKMVYPCSNKSNLVFLWQIMSCYCYYSFWILFFPVFIRLSSLTLFPFVLNLCFLLLRLEFCTILYFLFSGSASFCTQCLAFRVLLACQRPEWWIPTPHIVKLDFSGNGFLRTATVFFVFFSLFIPQPILHFPMSLGTIKCFPCSLDRWVLKYHCHSFRYGMSLFFSFISLCLRKLSNIFWNEFYVWSLLLTMCNMAFFF